MSVLTWRRHPHCARPVVVLVSQLVADLNRDEMHQAQFLPYNISLPAGGEHDVCNAGHPPGDA